MTLDFVESRWAPNLALKSFRNQLYVGSAGEPRGKIFTRRFGAKDSLGLCAEMKIRIGNSNCPNLSNQHPGTRQLAIMWTTLNIRPQRTRYMQSARRPEGWRHESVYENSGAASVWSGYVIPRRRKCETSHEKSHRWTARSRAGPHSMRGRLAGWLARGRALTLVRGWRAGPFAIDSGSDSSSARVSTTPLSSRGRDSRSVLFSWTRLHFFAECAQCSVEGKRNATAVQFSWKEYGPSICRAGKTNVWKTESIWKFNQSDRASSFARSCVWCPFQTRHCIHWAGLSD